MTSPDLTATDPAAADPAAADLARAVESVGQSLELDGIPRMPARVFAFVLTGNQETYSARDLAEGLEVSPAAVSGAVRYLTDTRLLVRERAPRTRGDLYRLAAGDVWATIMRARLPLGEQVLAGIDEAIGILEEQPVEEVGRGLDRLRETRDFFAFVQKDLAGMLDRWVEWREAH